jgi:hypothetical protein
MAKTLPEKLQTMRCRACQSLIKPDKTLATELGRRRAVSSRDDCIYRCSCGVSYSNAKNEAERIMIKASPELNVPKQVRPGLAEALARTLNHRNRRRKQLQFCFEDSEDAVIWTVFRGLEEQGRLDALVAPQHPPGEPALLFWGAPVGGARSPEVAAALEEVCRQSPELPALPRSPRAVRSLPRDGRSRRLLRADRKLAHRHRAGRGAPDSQLPARQPRPARQDGSRGRRLLETARPLGITRLRVLELDRHTRGRGAG